ncbi:Glycerophosphodiester phosphodiesterase domain [Trypanosoma melophagium]|uniref:Glycerophosphodiester phosphodiesterase domain n=1 Tax=Trypanosoma melophagium TaxID=715481 RepID=UPI00351A38BD|nr:Glycerophosphodiester phosphodiesterase domain [Trypanosoma melophagium]
MVWNGVIVVACVGGYIVAAVLLVRLYPFRLSKREKKELLKKRFPYSTTKIAHRGGSLMGPENTMYAFRRAVFEFKADVLELDVHPSKDGQIVVCHDSDLTRTCGSLNGRRKIEDIVVGENPSITLPQCLRKIPLHFKSFQKGDYYVATDSVPVDDTTRVCLLSEVFDAFPELPLHIDIKCEDAEFTRRVLKMIEDYRRETRTFVGTSNIRNRKHIYSYFKSVRSVDEEILKEKRKRFRIFAGPMDYVIVQVAYFFGILPLIPLSFDVFSIPFFTRLRKKELGSRFERFIAYFLNSTTLWDHLQRRGILVIGWVLNDYEEFEEASKWEVNGIMSDDPVGLKEFFDSHDVSSTMNLLD